MQGGEGGVGLVGRLLCQCVKIDRTLVSIDPWQLVNRVPTSGRESPQALS